MTLLVDSSSKLGGSIPPVAIFVIGARHPNLFRVGQLRTSLVQRKISASTGAAMRQLWASTSIVIGQKIRVHQHRKMGPMDLVVDYIRD